MQIQGCTSLESIEISPNIIEIGYEVFEGCDNLTSIKYYAKEVFSWLFKDKKNITNIIFGDNVEIIDIGAFQGCCYLTSITIPNKVTTIDEQAFYMCDSLKSITIGKNVTSIGTYAFYISNYSTNNIQTIYSLNPTPPDISYWTFNKSTQKTATLYVPIGSKEKYEQHEYWKNFANIIETEFDDIKDKTHDVNGDGNFNIDDITYLIDCYLEGNGNITVSDITDLIDEYLSE